MSRFTNLLATYPVRAFVEDDIPLVFRWFEDPVIREAIDDEPVGDDERRLELAELARCSPARDGMGAYLVERRGRPVGFIKLMWINWISRTVEVDLLVEPRGIGSLAATMVMSKAAEIAFEVLGLNKLYCFIYASNAISLSPLRRLLTIEATLTGAAVRNGKPTDVFIACTTAKRHLQLVRDFGKKDRRAE